MPPPRTRRRRIGRWLRDRTADQIDVLVLIALGTAGFVGSAGHVLHLAENKGQRGTGAWTVVGTVEVLAVYSGWQVRRRRGWRRLVALVILALAIAFTVAANLAASPDRSYQGLAMAVAPAAVFVAAMVLAETGERATFQPPIEPAQAATGEPPPPAATVAESVATAVAIGPTSSQVGADIATAEPPQRATRRAMPKSPQNRGSGDLDATVLAAVDRGRMLTMGEIVMATGRPRATVKTSVGRLVEAGSLVAMGDPRRPSYAVVEPASVAGGETR